MNTLCNYSVSHLLLVEDDDSDWLTRLFKKSPISKQKMSKQKKTPPETSIRLFDDLGYEALFGVDDTLWKETSSPARASSAYKNILGDRGLGSGDLDGQEEEGREQLFQPKVRLDVTGGVGTLMHLIILESCTCITYRISSKNMTPLIILLFNMLYQNSLKVLATHIFHI